MSILYNLTKFQETRVRVKRGAEMHHSQNRWKPINVNSGKT